MLPRLLFAVCLIGLAAGCLPGGEGSPETTDDVPNVVFIIADDLGYGELGSYGQTKIQTPNLDRMAAEGLRFTQFYSGSPVCAPSRATLMTGKHTGHTYVRDNYELGGFRDDEERGQLPLKPGTETIGTMLQQAGYATALIGKWGLGGPGSTGIPTRQGFDFFYGYLDQKQAHNYYPTHLWIGTDTLRWDTLRNDYFHPHQQLKSAPEDPSAYEQYKATDYAPDLMTQQALGYIREHQDQPFFLSLAYTIPHVALQVPDEELSAYQFEETPYLGEESYLPHPRPLAAYAGMISRMDGYVGQVLDLLGELGLRENTLVIFTSDNGTTFNGGVQADFFNSVGPLRGLKGSVYEGGIRVPMIAWWPGHIQAGTTTDHVAALWDVLPTVAELTGATPPDSIDGLSFLPTLLGDTAAQAQHDALYWEYHGLCGGQQAVRMGKWKGVRLGIEDAPGAPIRLYNLEEDVGETRNVAGEHPEVARQVWQQMQQMRTPPEIDRWAFAVAEQPALATDTQEHACFPWNR